MKHFMLQVVLAGCVASGLLLLAGSAGAKTEECSAADLTIRQHPSVGGLGSFYLVLAFKNRTRQTCETGGYSGVTLLGASGRNLGIARRAGNKPFSIALGAGKTVYETVSYGENATDVSSCPAVKAVRIYVPDSNKYSTVLLPHGSIDCGRYISVYRMAKTISESVA